MRLRLTVASVVLATACAAASTADNRYLEQTMPREWEATDGTQFDPAGTLDRQWWAEFGDSTLDSLVNLGVERNYNLKMAARRMQMARNTMNSAKGAWLPSLSLNAGWQKAQTSGRTTRTPGPAMRSDFWSGSLNMSWEIDIFGRVASQVKSDKALYQSSRDLWAGAMLSLEAEIADTYFSLRSMQAQLEVARNHSKSQGEVLKMTEARYEAGLASKLDVTQARRVYYSTIASIPMLESSIHAAINAIAVLVGEYPETMPIDLNTPAPLPQYIRIVGSGLPMNLLDRRPDVCAAREQIAASAASVGLSRKEFLPSLRLDGSLGTQAHSAGNLFTRQSYTWSIAPTLSWTIFDGFSRKYNLASAKEQLESDIENYNLTVLTAVEETDNAMMSYLTSLRHIELLRNVVTESEESLRLSLELYKLKLSAFTNVVDAQLTCLESENQVIEAKYSALSALINLYKALGGGWDNL